MSSSKSRVSSLVVAATIFLGLVGKQNLPQNLKYVAKDSANLFFSVFERIGFIDDFPVYDKDYKKYYPEFEILENNYDIIKQEAQALLQHRESIVKLHDLGDHQKDRIHNVGWRSFIFKMHSMIEENEQWAPKTYNIIKSLPEISIAYFSVLEPKQRIAQHFGYYKGFLTYHLGIIIPNNNTDHNCYLRVNPSVPYTMANIQKTKQGGLQQEIDAGEPYFWHNGESVVFSDMYLHDAQNESNEVRVVLFVDIARRFSFSHQPMMDRWVSSFITLVNKLFLRVTSTDPMIRSHQQKAIFQP